MSKRQVKRYTAEIKSKVVLEALKDEKTLAQIASTFQIPTTNILDWKKQFINNMELVFDKEKAVKKYKEQIKEKEEVIESIYAQLGEVTVKYNWVKKKSKEVGLED